MHSRHCPVNRSSGPHSHKNAVAISDGTTRYAAVLSSPILAIRGITGRVAHTNEKIIPIRYAVEVITGGRRSDQPVGSVRGAYTGIRTYGHKAIDCVSNRIKPVPPA